MVLECSRLDSFLIFLKWLLDDTLNGFSNSAWKYTKKLKLFSYVIAGIITGFYSISWAAIRFVRLKLLKSVSLVFVREDVPQEL